MKKYFGTDGVRGEANKDLTAELAMKLGRAAVPALGGPECSVVVGRDTRQSGPMLEDALPPMREPAINSALSSPSMSPAATAMAAA